MMAQFLKLPIIHRSRPDDLPGVTGRARMDRRTKNLTKRLSMGDIAIIDHVDLDKVSADALLRLQVAAVVNAAPSISGRYPNLGPQVLVEAGVPLVDNVGPEVFRKVSEGTQVRLHDGTLYVGDVPVAKGQVQTPETVAGAMAATKDGLAVQLQAFVANTLEYAKGEGGLLIDGISAPDLTTKIDGQHVLVVVRGQHYREDLAALRAYIREFKPVMVGVDGGADALIEAGYRPDIIVGDMDSVTDQGLTCGAELVVHAYPDGRAPGMTRLNGLGLDGVPLPAPGTSEDVALLLADAGGASLIAVVGTHWTVEEFLDKGRPGMASTFLTHLRVGSKLVNARGVHQLYQSRISGWALAALVVAAAVTIVVAIAYSPAGPFLGNYLSATWHTFAYWFTGLFK